MYSNQLSDKTYKLTARIGGISYLFLIALGLFAELFVREALITGDAVETVNNILSNELLFRSGFLSDLLMVVLDIIVGIVFYILLKKTNKILALSGLILRLSQSVLLAVNLLNMHSGLMYFKASSGYNDIRQLLGMNALSQFKYGYFLALVFFGMYLIVIALHLRKTDYFNKIITFFIGLSGGFYVADSLVNFIVPHLNHVTGSVPVMLLWIITEFAIAIELIRLSYRKKSFE